VVKKAQTIKFAMSDHLPLTIEVLIMGSGGLHGSVLPEAA
jgi:hypothetical protein